MCVSSPTTVGPAEQVQEVTAHRLPYSCRCDTNRTDGSELGHPVRPRCVLYHSVTVLMETVEAQSHTDNNSGTFLLVLPLCLFVVTA